MEISQWKYSTQFNIIIVFFVIVTFGSCKVNDEVAPILTLTGADSVSSPLNQPYDDLGATASDDTDGDMTSSIYIDNPVNEDLMGFYTITYNVVDQAGNSALPLERVCRVINSAYEYDDSYKAEESQEYGQDTCTYDLYFRTDSTVNYRMVFTSFACETGLEVYADITGTIVEIPLQTIEDSIRNISFQGAGYINDSLIFIEYSRRSDAPTTYWKALFKRQ